MYTRTVFDHEIEETARLGPLPEGWRNPSPEDLRAQEGFMACVREGRYRDALRWSRGSNHMDTTAIWCCLMTLTFGPPLHESYTHEDGSPDFSKMSDYLAREVRARQEEALKRLHWAIGL